MMKESRGTSMWIVKASVRNHCNYKPGELCLIQIFFTLLHFISVGEIQFAECSLLESIFFQ
jgi:hypothetical protein